MHRVCKDPAQGHLCTSKIEPHLPRLIRQKTIFSSNLRGNYLLKKSVPRSKMIFSVRCSVAFHCEVSLECRTLALVRK